MLKSWSGEAPRSTLVWPFATAATLRIRPTRMVFIPGSSMTRMPMSIIRSGVISGSANEERQRGGGNLAGVGTNPQQGLSVTDALGPHPVLPIHEHAEPAYA